MFQRNVMKALVGSVVLASLALTGCGAGSGPTGVDPYADAGTGVDPYSAGTGTGSYADPYGTGSTLPGTTLPGTTGAVNTGLGMPTAANALSATVTVLKKGVLLGKTKVKVDVMNASQAQATGTLTVTFTKKGKATKYVQTKTVSIAPGGTQSFEFTGAMIGTDGATAEVVTDAAPMGSNTGAYGNPTGTP